MSRLKALSRVRTTADELYVSVDGVVDGSTWQSCVSGVYGWLQVAAMEAAVSETEIFVSSTGNLNISI